MEQRAMDVEFFWKGATNEERLRNTALGYSNKMFYDTIVNLLQKK